MTTPAIKCSRALVLVKRDMAEEIPVCAFVHEIPILQVIHGANAVYPAPNPEQVLAQSTEGLDAAEQRTQVQRMLAPGEVDAEAEYGRLVERYGRHAEVNVSNVEYVYGRPNSRDWKDALKMKLADIAFDRAETPDIHETAARRAVGAQRPQASA